MATFIFTQDSLIGKTSVPTVYARIDGSKVRIFDTFDSAGGGTNQETVIDFLEGLGGVGLRSDGGIDWANTRVERYSWTQDFSTMPVSGLPSRLTDKYVLYTSSNDLLGATADFFATTMGGLKTPSGQKISEIMVSVDSPDPAGLDRLSVSIDQLTKISKSGAKISNVTLSVEDSLASMTTLLAIKPADLKVLGNVSMNLTPEQIAKLITDKKLTNDIVKGFTDVGIKVNLAVEDSAGLASLVANNTDLSSFSTLTVRLGAGLVSATGPLASGTEEQQLARTQQLGEFITAFSGKSLVVDPGVLMKLVATEVFWDLQPEIGLMKDSIDIRVEASLDRLVSLQSPSDVYQTTWGNGYDYDLTIGDYNVTSALNTFADGLTLVSDNSGGTFTQDEQDQSLNINSKLLRVDNTTGFFNYNTNLFDTTHDGSVIHRHGGVLGEIFNRAYENARYGGFSNGANQSPKNPDEAYASALAQMAKVELKGSDGNLIVTSDLVTAAIELGFKFAAADNVSVNLSANQQDASKSDLVSTFDGYDWRTGATKDFANAGKDGNVDDLGDLKALGIRLRNWGNTGDIDANGQDDAYEQVYVPSTGAWVNKIDWMFGFNGTNYEGNNPYHLRTFWNPMVQSWLDGAISDDDFLAGEVHVGFADLDGDGLADLSDGDGSGQSVSFAFLRSLQASGIDKIVSSTDILIDLDPSNNNNENYTLKAVVNFLKSTKLAFTREDGQVAKISVDSDTPIALSYADISALSKKGIALTDPDGVGLITLSASAADLLNSLKTITITDATSLALAGVSSVSVADQKKLVLTADQAKALAVSGLTFASGSYVVLADTAANIGLLSAAQISALGSMGLNAIDSSDNKEITLTDRQVRALLRADIIVDAGDILRAKISDDYLLKALQENGSDLGSILDQLASVGLDRISGTTNGLKMTAKMLSDAMPMISTETNLGGLVKVSSAAGAVDLKKPLSGIIVTYENESELTFLPASKVSLEALGAKFEQTVIKTFGVGGSAGNTLAAPSIKLAVGRDVVFKAEDFLSQRSTDGKTDVKLTDLSLVADNDIFTVRIKIGDVASSDNGSLALAFEQNLFFPKVKLDGQDTNWWYDLVSDGVPDAYQVYGQNAWPFERDWSRDWGGNDPNLPRFAFKYTDSIKALVATADGKPLTFLVVDAQGIERKFDVEIDRGRMDYLNAPWGADGITDDTPWDSSDDESDLGDFVVLRVVDDAAFENAVSALGQLPQGYGDAGSVQQSWAWLQSFINSSTLTTKSVASTELVTVTLDDETQQISGDNEYVVHLTGAQLKAGALVVTPNYGADGLDEQGMPLVNIFFEGGRAERALFSFSSSVNSTDWWRRGETLTVNSDVFLNDAWGYANLHGGTVSYEWVDGNYVPSFVNITQREFNLRVTGLDLNGDGLTNADDVRNVTMHATTWSSDQNSAMTDLARTLSGAPWGPLTTYDQDPWAYNAHGIDDEEYETLDALRQFVHFSGDNGRMVADFVTPGNMSADTLVFSEVNMVNNLGSDQDGVDVVSSDLYAATGAKNYFGVSSSSKLSAGDKLKFTITHTDARTAVFYADITSDLVKANNDQLKLLEAAMKAGVATDLKFVGGTTTNALLKSNIGLTTAKDAILVTLANKSYSIKVETVSEVGTLLVQQASKDGAGGNVKATVSAVAYNEAPEVAYSTSTQAVEGVFGSHTVGLSSVSVIDDSSNLQVTLSPTRGAYAGSFMFLDNSLFKEFVSAGYLKVQYMNPTDNKLVDALDKLPVGVGKIVITASKFTLDINGELITYKASDIINLVLSGTTFQLNRGLYSAKDEFSTGFDLAINDDYTAGADVLKGTFATGGERVYTAAVVHETLEDANGDDRIDANDLVIKLSTMRQLATNNNQEGLEAGLHATDNSDDTSTGIDNDIASAKIFSLSNKSLAHSFYTEYADMMVENGVSTNSLIYLHADEELQYAALEYAKAGFNTIYNETAYAMSMTVSEVNQLKSFGVGVVGDLEIAFESNSAEILVAPLRNLQSLTMWSTDDGDVADYVMTNFGLGDKLDLNTLLKIDKSKLALAVDETAAHEAYDTASVGLAFDLSTNSLYAAKDIDNQFVDYYLVGWNQSLGETVTKAHFQVQLTGVDISATTTVAQLQGFLV